MEYSDLFAMLGSREIYRIDAHTCIEKDDNGVIAVRFYDTRIVKLLPDGTRILNTDGYFNARTLKCMNTYLSYSTRVHQRKGLGICTINSIDYIYHEGIKLNPDDTTNATPFIIHELNNKTDHRVSSMAEVIQLIEGSTIDALKVLWRKCRYSRVSIAYYASLNFIPLIINTAKANEPWLNVAKSRLAEG